jgi:hypothetical protein
MRQTERNSRHAPSTPPRASRAHALDGLAVTQARGRPAGVMVRVGLIALILLLALLTWAGQRQP